MVNRLLFVYGTLLRGFGNHDYHIGRYGGTLLGEFITPPDYTMVSLGGFPGVVEGGSTHIKGEVYSLSEAAWRAIEGLEGYPTFYTRSPLITPYGNAELYVLNRQGDIPDRHVIESGSWREYLELTAK